MITQEEENKLRSLIVDLYIEQDTVTRHIIKHGEHDHTIFTKRNKAIETVVKFVDSIVLANLAKGLIFYKMLLMQKEEELK